MLQEKLKAIIGELPPIKVYPMTEDESILQASLEDDIVRLGKESKDPINFGLGLTLITTGLGAYLTYISEATFTDFNLLILISLIIFCPLIGSVCIYKWHVNKEKASKEIDDKHEQLKKLRAKITSRIKVMYHQQYEKVIEEETMELKRL